jgi:predicted double-glycine peptidase
MVAHYWASSAVTPSPKQIYERLYDAQRKGVLLAAMRRYLEELGFHAFTFRGQLAELESHLAKGRPVIVGLKKTPSAGLHFAVIAGTEGNQVWLNDPTRKRPHRLKKAEFERQWGLGDRWVLLATP